MIILLAVSISFRIGGMELFDLSSLTKKWVSVIY